AGPIALTAPHHDPIAEPETESVEGLRAEGYLPGAARHPALEDLGSNCAPEVLESEGHHCDPVDGDRSTVADARGADEFVLRDELDDAVVEFLLVRLVRRVPRPAEAFR